jgi:acyl-CoA thioester hydrolase
VSDPSPDARAPFGVDFRVRYAETDRMGVVYHAEYLVWCEVGRTEFIRAHLRSYAALEGEGIMLAVADASLRYHAGARYDELVRVETWLTEVRSRTLRFEYRIRRAATGERLVSASTLLVAVDPGGRGIAIPAEIRSALEEHVSAPPPR